MAPKQVKEAGSALTERDRELLVAAFQSTKSGIEIDYKVYAEKTGLKDARSAKASWNGLKKKLQNSNDSKSTSSSVAMPDEKSKNGSKKRKDEGNGDDGEGEGNEETSGKITKKGQGGSRSGRRRARQWDEVEAGKNASSASSADAKGGASVKGEANIKGQANIKGKGDVNDEPDAKGEAEEEVETET
ncbi:hypothetical protein KC342_g9751 [Hortaea werneckii]|nr:hypothetical protein KC342_g9751 [Hortaea werneckii]KAI7400742.1 hypothetical protein KC328_g3440 [Hortaea werneckii]